MLFQKEVNTGPVVIKGYQPGEINISGQIMKEPVIVSASQVRKLSMDFESLTVEAILEGLEPESEIILIGSGNSHKFVPLSLIQTLNNKGLAVEVMATRPACHTLQVLLFENRHVVAFLYP